MDMRISGSGKIPSGEYEKISISGSGRLYGTVRCVSFSASGTSNGESIECAESFRISGSCSFSDDIAAMEIHSSGSLFCGGNLTAKGKLICHGSTKCGESIRCEQLSVAGTLNVGGDIEAERVKSAGVLNCEGLLNAESIELSADRLMKIGSIGGGNIIIRRKYFSLFRSRRAIVASSIEGDDISLEYVTCPRVAGRIVVIGKGCKIDLVQYSESVEISPRAKVGRVEKV